MILTILGRCATKKNRPQLFTNRRTGKPMLIQSADSRAWDKSAVTQLKIQWRVPPITVPCRLTVTVFLHPTQRGDLTNYLSAVSDALEHAGVVQNDRLIQWIDARMVTDRARPRVECRVVPLTELSLSWGLRGIPTAAVTSL